MRRGPALAADLASLSTVGKDDLDAIRSAIAAAVAAGQPYPIAAGPGGGELAALLGGGSAEEDAAEMGVAERPLVLRRDLPLQPPTGPGALPAWALGRAGETVGRATGALGQPVLVESFEAPQATLLQRASASSPFLVVAGQAPSWDSHGNATLGPCTVWLAAALLAMDAPASSWVGLKISTGKISGALPALGPTALIVPDATTLKLELVLSPATPTAAASGPGQDARDADVRAPAKVSLVLEPGGGRIGELDEARLTAYGTTVRMRFAGAAATFAPEIASVVVPLDADADEWAPSVSASSLAVLGGKGRLTRAGWALAITRAAPATLGSAAGSGSMALRIEGLTLAFAAQPRPLPTGPAWLLAQPGLITLAADAAEGTGLGGQVSLYPEPGGGRGVGGRATFRFDDAFALRYLTGASGSEIVLAAAALDASLDRPATATAERVPLTDPTGLLVLTQDATATTLLLEGNAGRGTAEPDLTILLDNALLRLGAPGRFVVRGPLTTDGVKLTASQGTAMIVFPQLGLVPTLPDPYASTFIPAGPGHQAETESRAFATKGGATVVARLDWDSAAEPAELSLAFSQPTPAAGATEADRPAGDIATAIADAPARAAFAAAETGSKDQELLTELVTMLVNSTASIPGPIALLDVSSNADHFGVRMGIAVPPRGGIVAATPPASHSGPAIEGMSLVAPAHTVSVTTLPAVQWEPINGPGSSGPFSPMDFPNSGGESEVTPRSVRLVPVAPNPALAQMIADYDDKSVQEGVVAFVTFPFGIRAVARLDPPSGVAHSGAELDLHRPAFAGARLEGAKQLRAVAVRRILALQGGSASFPGATVQLSSGQHNGVPSGLSPIDPLTEIFNEDFGPGGRRPQVPVDRFELSGYGESAFSDWKDDSDDATAISEVRFDVLNGRTSVEVVQARSVLYPYGIRVIRTIKMLRDNAGRMQRTDSGWQAQSDGIYAWPRPDLRTHPGVVGGVTGVKGIRDTGQRWTSSAGTELMAVRFDCLVDLDGAVAGGGTDGVPSREQLGFVQISANPPHGISPAEFAELIDAFGPLGGPVDAVVAVGDAGLRSRVARVGVGVTDGAAGPEFAMAAWGSPVLPRGGPWSVLKRSAGDPAPSPVDPALGVPLIRAGYAGTPPDPGAPFRFADPGDLAAPETPAVDYALMHATSSQRVLFPRPKVTLSGPRAGELTSSQPPVLADPFLMATAVGPFPPLATAIGFPDADYGLRPLAGGDLVLDLPHNDFQVSGGDRMINSAGGSTFFVRYRDEAGDPATVHLELDSGKPVPWAFGVGGVELCLANAMMGEVVRLLGRVEAGADRPGRLTGGTLHFGKALDSIEFLTDFLGTNKLADLQLASRNRMSIEIAEKIPIVGGPQGPKSIDIGIGKLTDADLTVGVKIDLSSGEASSKLELGGIVAIRTLNPALVLAAQAKFELESDKSGETFKFTLGVGFGLEFEVAKFKAKGYVFQNDYLIVGRNEIGFGVGLELKASIDLAEALTAEIDVEGLASVIHTQCPAGKAMWLVTQLTIGVDITIAWIIDIDFEFQLQGQSNLDGGPCPAPMA